MGFVVGIFGHWLIPVTVGHSALLFGGLGILSTAYAFDEIGIFRLPHPQRVAQVPASWRGLFPPHVTALLYGLGLGVGIATRIVTGALYIVLIGLFAYGSPFYAAMSFGLFGFGRGASVLLVGWYIRNLHSDELHRAVQWLTDQEDRIHDLMGIILVQVGLNTLMVMPPVVCPDTST